MIISTNKKDPAAVKAILNLMDDLRRSMQADDSLRVIIALAVVAKITPDEFSNLYRQPKAAQRESLISLLDNHPQLRVIDSLEVLREKHLTAEAIQVLIYGLYDVKDFAELAEQLLSAYSGYSGRRGAECTTEDDVAELIKKLAGDVSASVVYDPAAGLCNVVSRLQCKQLHLEEVNKTTRDFGKNILILKGIEADYLHNDSLFAENSLFSARPSVKADLVVVQPPFGLRFTVQQQDALRDSEFLQFDRGERIPASAGDALWIQHALHNMNAKGRAMILLPQGWLFRGGYDARLRQHLLDHDLIEAIIGLPAGLLQSVMIPTVLLILNKKKPLKSRGAIAFVDAGDFGKPAARKKSMSEAEIDLIVSLVKGEKPEHQCFRSVLLPEIYANNNDLNIKKYIDQEEEVEMPNLKQEQAKLKEAQEAFTEAQKKLISLLAGKVG